MDRRRFLQIIGAAGVTAAIPWRFDWKNGLHWAQAQAFMISPALPLWGTALRGVGPAGIPVAAIRRHAGAGYRHPQCITPSTSASSPIPSAAAAAGTTGCGVITRPKPWEEVFNHRSTWAASSWPTRAPPSRSPSRTNLLAADWRYGTSSRWMTLSLRAGSKAQNRTAVHLHGGHIPWYSDGGPFDWWDPFGTHGPSFLNNVILNPSAAGTNQAEYYYTMDQSARFLWYHDHAYGITRINAYAGIASALLIRDKFEANLVLPANRR